MKTVNKCGYVGVYDKTKYWTFRANSACSIHAKACYVEKRWKSDHSIDIEVYQADKRNLDSLAASSILLETSRCEVVVPPLPIIRVELLKLFIIHGYDSQFKAGNVTYKADQSLADMWKTFVPEFSVPAEFVCNLKLESEYLAHNRCFIPFALSPNFSLTIREDVFLLVQDFISSRAGGRIKYY